MNRSKRIVLYVSDNKFMHIIITDTLKSYNVEVVHAYEGQSALDKLKQSKVDLVLTDIDMPGMDGFQLCEKVRALNLSPPPNVVVYSGSESPEDIEKAFTSGAKGYIVKKYQKEALAQRIIHHIP